MADGWDDFKASKTLDDKSLGGDVGIAPTNIYGTFLRAVAQELRVPYEIVPVAYIFGFALRQIIGLLCFYLFTAPRNQ